ncbi:MAG: tetratricopeptide repeat protein [Betaproteobacteria bacterium]|nr:MAG: tetratricopeptide repeat protein [Betaproteobacteria bacterium]
MATKSKETAAPNPSVSLDSDELVALARVDIERGAFTDALLKIKQVLADQSPPAEAFALGGRLYAQLGLWPRARPCYERYLQANPNAVTEAFELGMVRFDSGDAAEARKIWSDLLGKHPTHPPSLFYRALALAQGNSAADARKDLDVLLKSASPDNLYFGRGRDLLRAIDSQPTPGASNTLTAGTLRIPTKDAYKH